MKCLDFSELNPKNTIVGMYGKSFKEFPGYIPEHYHFIYLPAIYNCPISVSPLVSIVTVFNFSHFDRCADISLCFNLQFPRD